MTLVRRVVLESEDVLAPMTLILRVVLESVPHDTGSEGRFGKCPP